MGRYYSGDIEGKFWFGLQASDAPSRFGGVEQEPAYITYYFKEENLEEIEQEIKAIEEKLGAKKEVIDKFFENHNGYNETMLKENSISSDELLDYADLGLGIQIRDCVKKQGYCSIDCEI